MRLISWNIDSLNAALTSDSARAVMTRLVLDKIDELEPDIIAIQETKLPYTGPSKKHMAILEERLPGYKLCFNMSQEPARKSYAGTMFAYKESLTPEISMPLIGAPTTMDHEGRIITMELPEVFISQVYTPNAGEALARLEDRQAWDKQYAEYLATLDQIKPVIAMGDFNVAHKPIDLANPEANRRSAGFTDEEREGFTNLLAKGFVDIFRYLHGDVEGVYTWWAQRVRTSKINNSGWRIDYFVVSDRIKDKVVKNEIVDSGDRQDHAPILLDINL
jgi:exodeoxyribonuclease-3